MVPPPEDLVRVTTSDGKYTFVQTADKVVSILLYGQPWLRHMQEGAVAVIALACGYEEAQKRLAVFEAKEATRAARRKVR